MVVDGVASAGFVTVQTDPQSCPWTAVSNAPDWIHITSGSSGTGNGVVNFNVDKPNTARTGTLNVAGVLVTVAQNAP